jgi:ABC-type sugar transport system ATPase subunit
VASLFFADVWKEYGEVQALRGLDLEVPDGELLTIVGPSGCGKSTALRSAAGLEDVTSGTISIGGRDVTRVPAGKRNVSMVFQSYALFPHLTVKENIAFGLAARRVPKQTQERRVRSAAELVGCDGLYDRRPYQLSGGERQRVALARALVRRPDVYLLDEPLSNLDAQLRVRMRAELKQLHQRLGSTMVYVTHDQVEALTLGHRVAVLHDGVLQQVATPTEIYRRPVNRFVGTFIGSPAMNILPLQNVDGVFHAGPFVLGQATIAAEKLELGIRPEQIIVSLDGAADGAPAEVDVVEEAGNETFLHLQAAGHELVARAGPDIRPPVGTTVRIRQAPSRLYLFDAQTGEAVYR